MKLKDGLYNKAVYLPKLNIPDRDIPLEYTYHAKEAALTDRFGIIILPESINLKNCDIIEIEIKNSDIVKMVVRTSYNEDYDITLVISFTSGKVKTVWLNRKDDLHNTLNKSNYISEHEAYIK